MDKWEEERGGEKGKEERVGGERGEKGEDTWI